MKFSPKNLYSPKEVSKLEAYAGKDGSSEEPVPGGEESLSFRDLLAKAHSEMYMGRLDDALYDIAELGKIAETTPTEDDEFFFLMYLCARTANCSFNLVSSDTVFEMMRSKLESCLPIDEYPTEWFLYYYEFGSYNDIIGNSEEMTRNNALARALIDKLLPEIHCGATFLLRDIAALANDIEEELFTTESGPNEILSRYNNLLLITDGLDENNPDVQYARSVAYMGLGDYSYAFGESISEDDREEMEKYYSLAEKEISRAIAQENSQNMYSLNQLNSIRISRLYLLYIEESEDWVDRAFTLFDEGLDLIAKIQTIDAEYAHRRLAHLYWSFGSIFSYKEYLEKAAELFRIAFNDHPDIKYLKENIAQIAQEISELE